MFGRWHEQKIHLFRAQVDLAFSGQDAGLGIEHKGLAVGNAFVDIELDDGAKPIARLISPPRCSSRPVASSTIRATSGFSLL